MENHNIAILRCLILMLTIMGLNVYSLLGLKGFKYCNQSYCSGWAGLFVFAKQCLMSDSHREGQALKIPECGALGEVLYGMLQSPEDDSLGPGEHQRDHPGRQHHPPEQREKLASDLFYVELTSPLFFALKHLEMKEVVRYSCT